MMKHIYRLFICVLAVSSIQPALAQYEWNNAGPDNIGSLTRALAFDGEGNLLAGSQGGGLWKSSNEGQSWSRVAGYDEANGNPNITSIAVDGSTIYVATGATKFSQPFPISSLSFSADWDYRSEGIGFTGYLGGFPGNGVYVSKDNGATWSNSNATTTGIGAGTATYKGPFTDIQKVLVSGDRVFVATAEGLYYSDNELNTLTKANGSAFFQENLIFDVEAAANNRIIASVHLDASGQVDSLFISSNNGTSFAPVREDLLTNGGTAEFSFNRAEIAVAPSDNNIIYVAATQLSGEINGVYRYNISEDRWSQVGPRGAPGFSPLSSTSRTSFVLEVFPDNPNELILAGSRWFTFLEGEGWTQTATPFNPTADTYIPFGINAVVFDPTDPNTMFVSAGQEIRYSGNRAQSFSNRSKGYETGTIYSVSAINYDIQGEEEDITRELIYAGTANAGSIVNSRYKAGIPSSQSFGVLAFTDNGGIGNSVLYPGGLILQGGDGGLVRSINYGSNIEQFYQTSIPPQVANLEPQGQDSVINKQNDSDESGNLF
ncbi:MAG: hypothetical protein AAFV07_08800, partial [Bacteroidota bacterium]